PKPPCRTSPRSSRLLLIPLKKSSSASARTPTSCKPAPSLPGFNFHEKGASRVIAEIICVGTELLLGDIVNSNAQFLSRELAELGVTVLHQHVVGDNPARLRALVQEAKDRSDLLVFSGGLGPTADDLTKETVAEVF